MSHSEDAPPALVKVLQKDNTDSARWRASTTRHGASHYVLGPMYTPHQRQP
jgi:hypothetical protein